VTCYKFLDILWYLSFVPFSCERHPPKLLSSHINHLSANHFRLFSVFPSIFPEGLMDCFHCWNQIFGYRISYSWLSIYRTMVMSGPIHIGFLMLIVSSFSLYFCELLRFGIFYQSLEASFYFCLVIWFTSFFNIFGIATFCVSSVCFAAMYLSFLWFVLKVFHLAISDFSPLLFQATLPKHSHHFSIISPADSEESSTSLGFVSLAGLCSLLTILALSQICCFRNP
jgi:hypothetical protein